MTAINSELNIQGRSANEKDYDTAIAFIRHMECSFYGQKHAVDLGNESEVRAAFLEHKI